MKVLFLTMYNFESLHNSGIYEDLMREFRNNGHEVFVVSPAEKRIKLRTHISESDERYSLLRVRTGNLQKTNLLEKGISTLRVAGQFKRAIKRTFSGVKFDLILYSTPPITLVNVVSYFKKRDKALTVLLLKDIFPQNAVDIGILKKSGLKGFIYKFFRKKEKKLYAISDYIGCMSRANVEYIANHNSHVDKSKLGIIPNSIEKKNVFLSEEERKAMRNKYELPQGKKVFIYGGNLGKPQDIPFVIDCMRSQKNNDKAFFFIVGDGTEYNKLEQFVNNEKPNNVRLIKRLPREDFDTMLAACDVGLIFLDNRFTIPNYPSRLLSYMQAGLPVLACTDKNTDVGRDIVNGDFGWWCESNNVGQFAELVQEICDSDLTEKCGRSKKYLNEYFTVAKAYSDIINTIGEYK